MIKKGTAGWWVGAAAAATLVVLVSVAAGAHKREDLRFDIFDEAPHYDYVVALRGLYIPAWGDTMDQRTLRAAGCLGYEAGAAGNDCTKTRRNPDVFSVKGYSYEAQQPPLGYVPFALAATPDAEPKAALAAARNGGVLWSSITAGLLVGVAAVEGLSLLGLTVLLTTCLLSPLHIYAAATVNNDAAAVASGSLAFLVVAMSGRRKCRRPGLIGLAAGSTIAMIKGVFVIAPFVLAVVALLAERPWAVSRPEWRAMARRNACVLGMLVGGVVTSVAWVVFQNLRAKISSAVVIDTLLSFTHTDHLKVESIVQSVKAQTSLLLPYHPDAPVHYLWNISFFAVVIGVILLKGRQPDSSGPRLLAIASLCGIVATATSWTVFSYLQGQYDGVAGARYGLPLLPLMSMVVVRSVPRSGLVALGVILPSSAVVWQLVLGKF